MKKYIFLIGYLFLFTISTTQTEDRIISPEQSLYNILYFINKSNPQSSPIFDLTAKPRVDHVKSVLDRISQKAVEDKVLFGDTSNKKNEQELKIADQQQRLRSLYESNPELFLSEDEEKKLTKGPSIISKTPAGAIRSDLRKATSYQTP